MAPPLCPEWERDVSQCHTGELADCQSSISFRFLSTPLQLPLTHGPESLAVRSGESGRNHHRMAPSHPASPSEHPIQLAVSPAGSTLYVLKDSLCGQRGRHQRGDRGADSSASCPRRQCGHPGLPGWPEPVPHRRYAHHRERPGLPVAPDGWPWSRLMTQSEQAVVPSRRNVAVGWVPHDVRYRHPGPRGRGFSG